MFVTRKTLARCLGLSERRVTQLRRLGITKRDIFKGYELEASIQSYLNYKLKR